MNNIIDFEAIKAQQRSQDDNSFLTKLPPKTTQFGRVKKNKKEKEIRASQVLPQINNSSDRIMQIMESSCDSINSRGLDDVTLINDTP